MKKIKKVVLLLLTLCLAIPVHTVNVQAATVEKTSIMSAKQVGKKSAQLVWDEVDGAKGYEVAYRVAGGKWTTKSTTKNYITISKLKVNKTYQFKVRAYKNVNKSVRYGKYSVPKKVKINKYVYLGNLYEPYNSSESYEPYINGNFIMMGGKKRLNGFTLGFDCSYTEKKADFNIEGKYSKVTFKVGKVDGANNSPSDGDFDVNVYADGVLVDTIVVQVDDLPQSVSVNLDYTERLTFEVESDAKTVVGFSDIKLYFR